MHPVPAAAAAPPEPLAAPVDATPVTRDGLRTAVAGSLAWNAVEGATLLALATVVPRTLGPADFGRLSLALTLVTLGAVALTLGGPALMAAFVAVAPDADRGPLAWALGRQLLRSRAVPVAVLGIAAVVAALVAPDRLALADAAIVVVALGVNVVTSVALHVALGLGVTWPWTARFPIQNVVLIAVVLVLHPVAGAPGAVIAVLVSALAGLAFALCSVRPLRPRSIAHDAPEIPTGALRFGALQAGGAALVHASQRGAVVAAALLAGSSAEVGRTAVATGLALGATYAVAQAFAVALPHLASSARARTTTRDPEARARRLGVVLWCALLPCTALFAVVLDDAVRILFGPGYTSAADAFGPALALVLLSPLATSLVTVSALRHRGGAALAGGLASMVGFVVVAIATIPAWGAAGALAAVLAGTIAAIVISMIRLPGATGAVFPLASGLSAAGVLALCLLA